ncbi:MAG: acyl-CoA dehydrogenase C-terminal domain-containing protein, partial [Methylocystis sp.]|nr:acyl-CoA dehydrogenase C-terminal domain-containing protein [Methylocystis sp.]
DYMHLFGRVALGVIWVKIAQAAIEKKAREPHEAARMDAKLLTARFYMERMLPETSLRLTRISTGADTMMSLPEEMF